MRRSFGVMALGVIAFSLFAACGGGGATLAPPTAQSPTAMPAATATPVVTAMPVAIGTSAATFAAPSPTPGIFAISPEATQVPIAPSLLRLRPTEVVPGSEIELEGTGGHIELRTADGSRIGFIESSTSFPVFLADETIGSIKCFVNTCRGTVTIPQETLPGNHQISVEGGSSLTLTVVGGPQVSSEAGPLVLAASAFSDREPIPVRYSCAGEDISPVLGWSGVPPGTEILTLIMDDPDAPGGTWDHWILFNIPADVRELEEAQPDTPRLPNGGIHGKNSWGKAEYGGPCPPRGPAHNYRFFLYAVDIRLELPEGASKKDVLDGLQGHILEESLLTGTFAR